MSRTLRFPAQAVGQVYVMGDGSSEQVPAQGDVEIPVGAHAALLLDESAAADLACLHDVDRDVVVAVRLARVDAAGVAQLSRQEQLAQAGLGTAEDAALVGFSAPAVEMVEVTLVDEGAEGVAALAQCGLTGVTLHGDPGAALGDLARSTTLRSLHVHLPVLGLQHLRTLATSTHLESLSVEVEEVLGAGDPEAVEALVAIASGLNALGVSTAEGEPGLEPQVRLAVLRAAPALVLNGVSYTSAALSRLERTLVHQ